MAIFILGTMDSRSSIESIPMNILTVERNVKVNSRGPAKIFMSFI